MTSDTLPHSMRILVWMFAERYRQDRVTGRVMVPR
jgi:hypothetical protein